MKAVAEADNMRRRWSSRPAAAPCPPRTMAPVRKPYSIWA